MDMLEYKVISIVTMMFSFEVHDYLAGEKLLTFEVCIKTLRRSGVCSVFKHMK